MRKPTKRPVGEHMTVLNRMLQQVEVDDELSARTKTALKKHLAEALQLLQQELVRTK